MSLKKLSLSLVPIVFFSLFPILLSAQDNMAQAMSVTGCLKQGTDAGGYYIMANGKMYEVMAGHGVNLAEHAGHTVTVTGHPVKLSEADEAKKEASEKAEAGSSPYMDFRVTSLKMVSATCSQ
jgi:hypothetical protein